MSKNIISYQLLILCNILMCLVGMASAYDKPSPSQEYLAGETLKAIVTNFLDKQGVTSFPAIDMNKKFPSCKKPLAIFPMFKSWSTVEVVCTDSAHAWKVLVRTRAHSHSSKSIDSATQENGTLAIIAAKSLTKGHVISEKDLQVMTVKKSIGNGLFKKKENLVGRRLKTNVSVGYPLRSRHLEPDWVIINGDEIEILQSGSTITVSARGKALQNGQKGEKIKVRNLSSNKNLVAWVINEKKVTINANSIEN